MKKYLFLLLISFVIPSVYPDESDIYILESEELQEILVSMMEVSVELDNIDEIVVNNIPSLNTLERRKILIDKMNELKARKDQVVKRMESAEHLLLSDEKEELENTINMMDSLYDYNDVLEDPFIILSNIINFETLSTLVEFEGLIDILIKNHSQYQFEYNNFVDSSGKFIKGFKIERLIHVVSRVIEDWIKLNLLNKDTLFKNDLSHNYKKRLTVANNLYRSFLKRIYKHLIRPSIQMQNKGSFPHHRILIAMLLSSEKEREYFKLFYLYVSHKRNSIPLPDHIEEFFETYHLKTTKILEDLQQYVGQE